MGLGVLYLCSSGSKHISIIVIDKHIEWMEVVKYIFYGDNAEGKYFLLKTFNVLILVRSHLLTIYLLTSFITQFMLPLKLLWGLSRNIRIRKISRNTISFYPNKGYYVYVIITFILMTLAKWNVLYYSMLFLFT